MIFNLLPPYSMFVDLTFYNLIEATSVPAIGKGKKRDKKRLVIL